MAMIAFHLSTGKFFDRIDVLNAGVVHQDVDAAEFGPGLIDHLLDLVGIGDIGAGIHHANIVLPLEIAHDFVDLVGRAEAVEHDIGAGSRRARSRCRAQFRWSSR